MTVTITIGQQRLTMTNSAEAHRTVMDGLGWIVGGETVEPINRRKPNVWKRQRNHRKSRRRY